MPTNSNKKVQPVEKTNLGKQAAVWIQKIWRRIFGPKTPHRSFRMTRRRDAVRTLKLPGYLALTHEVFRIIFTHKKLLLGLGVVYFVLYGILVGVGSQETYASLSGLLKESAGDAFQGVSGSLWQAGILFTSIATSGLNEALTPTQQIFGALLFIMLWLSVVWLLRSIIAGKKVKMRDGLYNSGTPLFASIVVVLLILLQLLPVGIALVGYTAASSTGLLVGGVEAMLFWIAASLLGLLSLYWILSSFFALIIVTIPGTYPLWAMQTSSKLVSGRRVQLLMRLIWLGIITALTWVAVLVPMILVDAGLKSLIPVMGWVPFVPLTILILSSWSIIWGCTYVYLLYRKVVDNESK
ncbi:hypothetical protein KI440_01420 [Candidatus Saccharibacteria bacterium TM7i]|nr:hypothetical protein KI440_01420 [Candidatus Saccharibacteria bacterium TM7i]